MPGKSQSKAKKAPTTSDRDNGGWHYPAKTRIDSCVALHDKRGQVLRTIVSTINTDPEMIELKELTGSSELSRK